MKKQSAIYAVTTVIVILLASLIGCDCVTATDWGFGPVQPEAETVEDANIHAMKVPAIEPQEMICDENGCRLVETVPASTGFAPGVTYYIASDACPCGCGIAGCTCGGRSANTGTFAANAGSYLANTGTYTVTTYETVPVTATYTTTAYHGGYGLFGLQSSPVFNRGSGYGIFGNRARPLFWRFRPFLRARNGW